MVDSRSVLMGEFIPTYRPKPEKPKRVDANGMEDWWKAGGTLIGGPGDFTAFYQAQFAKVIEAKKGELRKSRAWVFGWFANENARTSPGEAAKRRELLPRPYRKRQTSGSLRQAFNSIPLQVRKDPDACLPRTLQPPPWVLGAYALASQDLREH